MCDYLKSIAGWNSDGSLGLHWMERDMGNGALSANGCAIVPLRPQARFFRITFEGHHAILRIGPGDHTTQEFELTREQLKGLVLDVMPELLR